LEVLRYRVAAVFAAVIVILLPLALGACGSDDNAEADAKPTVHTDFDAKNFSDSTNIDNKFNPLVPGTQYVFEGRSNRGFGRLPHEVIFTVTDLVKEIDGVPSRVMWDQDINNGKRLEGELAMFAQDDDGNVWNMGEYPEEYSETGKFEDAPDTWLSGVQGARAGVHMRADPKTGTSTYRQGFAPKIGFADVAKVVKTGQKNCVPTGCYDDVVVTDETNPTEPTDGHQLKYSAPDVGYIRAAPGQGGKEREVLVLVKVRKLGATELAKARRDALRLDKRAYRSKPEVWGDTPPATRASQ
jgi:hypothetical protein